MVGDNNAAEGHVYVVEGAAVPSSLSVLHDLMSKIGEEHPDLSAEDLFMLETAVIEIAGNLIEHGRPEGSVDYRLSLEILTDRLEGLLADSGQEFSGMPVNGVMPDPTSEDGRGLLLAQAVLDELTYERTGDGNTWRMVRRRRP